MDFAREAFTPTFLAEWQPLTVDHYKEISANQDIPLDPDLALYYAMEAAGILRVFTVRDGPRLVGYAFFAVKTNLHYKGSLQAQEDLLFLAKPYRGQMTGYKFIKWCDEQLARQDRVQIVYRHVKFAHDFSPLLERIGYKPIDKIMGRRLESLWQ